MKIDLGQALDNLQQMRAEGGKESIANALFVVGMAQMQKGRPAPAKQALDEALELCRELGNRSGEGQVLMRLAELAQQAGDLGPAKGMLDQALESFVQAQDDPGRAAALERRARLFQETGDLGEAAASLEEALALAGRAGDELSQMLLNQYLAPVYRGLEQNDKALEAYRRLGALSQKNNEPQREALAMVGVGTLLAAKGQADEAEKAFLGAEEVFKRLGQPKQAEVVAAERHRLLGP
ncbi:MAG: tetratricopeptide repeat protein [Deltaproteobacteria bacterium]|nr:tetratricopeptide repeat protein [Deltaproteobacteria bacterium]